MRVLWRRDHPVHRQWPVKLLKRMLGIADGKKRVAYHFSCYVRGLGSENRRLGASCAGRERGEPMKHKHASHNGHTEQNGAVSLKERSTAAKCLGEDCR